MEFCHQYLNLGHPQHFEKEPRAEDSGREENLMGFRVEEFVSSSGAVVLPSGWPVGGILQRGDGFAPLSPWSDLPSCLSLRNMGEEL